MARTNKGEDGKPLSYAEQNRDRIIHGGEAPRIQEEIDELDQADVQDKILNPKEIVVRMVDGNELHVKRAFGPAAFKKRRVMDCLSTLAELLIVETSKLSGDPSAESGDWFARNQIYLQMAGKRMNIKMITVESLNALANTSRTVDEFEEPSLLEATFDLFRFYLEEVSEANKSPKNVKGPQRGARGKHTRS